MTHYTCDRCGNKTHSFSHRFGETFTLPDWKWDGSMPEKLRTEEVGVVVDVGIPWHDEKVHLCTECQIAILLATAQHMLDRDKAAAPAPALEPDNSGEAEQPPAMDRPGIPAVEALYGLGGPVDTVRQGSE